MSKRESRTQSLRKKLRYSFKSLKGYKYVNDYNNTSHKECARYDEENQYLYEKNVALYNRTSKMLEKRNAIFGLPEPPRKPRSPSNVELFIIFKRRKEKTDNKLQTLAVIYLLKKNYNLIVDPDVSLIGSFKNTFEPYQAIELAEKIAREHNENFVKDTLNYVNENKIYIKDEPQDKTVSQKIRFYNDQEILIRKKSDSSIKSHGRERSNSDTFVIEQKVNEMKAQREANMNQQQSKAMVFNSTYHDMGYHGPYVSMPQPQPLPSAPLPSAPLNENVILRNNINNNNINNNNSSNNNIAKQLKPPAYTSNNSQL